MFPGAPTRARAGQPDQKTQKVYGTQIFVTDLPWRKRRDTDSIEDAARCEHVAQSLERELSWYRAVANRCNNCYEKVDIQTLLKMQDCFLGTGHTLDGSEIRLTHHLRLAVYPIIYRCFYCIPGGCHDFFPSTVPSTGLPVCQWSSVSILPGSIPNKNPLRRNRPKNPTFAPTQKKPQGCGSRANLSALHFRIPWIQPPRL